MGVTVTRKNTTLKEIPGSGWVRVVYDTGDTITVDKRDETGRVVMEDDGKTIATEQRAVLIETAIPRAALEVSAGVSLPNAAIKAEIERALSQASTAQTQEVDVAGLL